jgi:mono/diheme cytochrome c family protein
VCDATGSVYGVTYKWRADNSDAELLATNSSEILLIKTANGTRTQTWYYPSRQDCRTCHTDLAGGVLGVKTRQLNCQLRFPSGVSDNQLRAWNHIGLFDPPCEEGSLRHLTRLARPDDRSRTVEDRARSYLDANCAQCHRPGGTVAAFDARYDTPLGQQNLLDAPVLIDEGIDRARAIAPHDIWRSIVLLRINTLEAIKMPPLAHEVLDHQAIATMRQWIESMPGPKVLEPPEISPRGGNFAKGIAVTLEQSEPGASIHYTLDGSVPTSSDPVYQEAIQLTGSTVVRAKAFKSGYAKSITAQEVFIIGE